MATKSVYAQFGAKPAAPVNQTDKCSTCEPTSTALMLPDLGFDSEADARTCATNVIGGNAIVQAYAKEVWDALWTRFQCVNKECANKDPCGAKPTYFEYGSITVQVPLPAPAPPLIVWQLYIVVAREIRCVKDGGGKDVTPQIPKIKDMPPPPEPPGKGAPGGLEGLLLKHDQSELYALAAPSPHHLEVRPLRPIS
jgi:hypothetical protein